MRSLLLVVLAACGAKAMPGGVAPRPAPVAPVARVAPAAPKPSKWPVPLRVMTWTSSGVVQIGTLPDAPPASPPATPWYVEPTVALDRGQFAKLIVALREEHVPGLSLRDQPVERWLGELRDLPELTALILDDTLVTTADLAFELPLQRVYLARTQVDDGVVAKLPAQLQAIDLEDCAITDRGARALAELHELRAVNLAGTRITDGGGAALGKLARLEIVDLGGTRVGDKTIAALRGLPLREIFLDHTRAGAGIATFAPLAPGLVRFDVSALDSYHPSDADVAWLANAPNLVEVGLNGSKVHDKLVLAVVAGAAPGLREIRLAGAPITLAAIQAIAKLPDLEEADLAETPVDDASAVALVGRAHMRVLRLDGAPISDAALATAPSPALVELYVSRTRVGDAGLALLDRVPQLEALGAGDLLLADATVTRIAKLSHLRTLVLSKARTGRVVLGQLGKLHALERLYLDQTRANDDTVAALAPLRLLRVLHLADTNLSEAALPVLRGFHHLDELTIGETGMRDTIADLDAWPHLRTLSVQGLEITDDALPKIARRTSLVALDLSATEVQDPAKLGSLPNLRILGLAQTHLTAQGDASVKTLAARGIDVVR
jgi:Leucine-rich repeat (LRR) protein